MLRRIFFSVVILYFVSAGPVEAIYDPLSVPNNRFGIHILGTNEVDKAAELVNSSGGDWGYVTIPIRANERDLNKWTDFMNQCRQKHLIPLLRIASFPVGEHWMAPNEWDLVDFANFLDSLLWPTENRYVIIYNEPNHDSEWGGFVYPAEYARVLDRAIDIFHKKNSDFFIISGGFDSAAPNGNNSMNEYVYMGQMVQAIPDIFNKIDGFSTHSYGNPAFDTFPNVYSPMSVANYRFEENYLSTLGVAKPKLFITEAGFRNDLLGDETAKRYLDISFNQIWTDDNIVAITPFLLSAQAGPFTGFSFTDSSGGFKPFALEVKQMNKTRGEPRLREKKSQSDLSIPVVMDRFIGSVSPGKGDTLNIFDQVKELIFKFIHFKI